MSNLSSAPANTSNPEADPNIASDIAIEITGLEKTYAAAHGQPQKRALKGIDLKVRRGSMFGLLGPNGAGKSTCINILAGLVNKTGGRARVWGFDIDRNPRNAKASIGIVPQEIYFDAFFTPREMLEQQAGLFGVPPAERRTEEILAAVSLLDKADAYSRTLSGGMKRRLLVAKAMVHNPQILVLDEPTAGVDIELRQQLWSYIRQLNAEGVTIVLTTHYLEEAEKLCDEIAIINHGEVAACAPTAKLLASIEEKSLIIRTDKPVKAIPAALSSYTATIRSPHELMVQYNASEGRVCDILDAVRATGHNVRDISTEQGDLEDIFLQLTRVT